MIRLFFIDVFHHEGDIHPLEAVQPPGKGLQTIAAPPLQVVLVMAGLIGQVTDYPAGLKNRDQLDDLVQPFPGDLPDPGVDGPGGKIEKRGVEGAVQVGFPNLPGYPHQITQGAGIEHFGVDPDFQGNPVFQHQGEVLIPEHEEGDTDVDGFG